jgi:hypothetical protein
MPHITGDWRDQSVRSVVREICDAHALVVVPSDDRFVLHRLVGGESWARIPFGINTHEELLPMLGRLVGESDAHAVGDDLYIFGSSADVDRAKDVAREVHRGRHAFRLTLTMVESSDALAQELGLDHALVGNIAAEWSSNGGAPSVSMAIAASGLLRASRDSTQARVVHVSALHLVPGTMSSMHSGDTIPVPQRTVSDQGTVTVTGYTSVRSGLQLEASVAESPGLSSIDQRVHFVELVYDLSTVTAFVEDVPRLATRTLRSRIGMVHQEPVILGRLDHRAVESFADQLTPLGVKRKGTSHQHYYVLAMLEVM